MAAIIQFTPNTAVSDGVFAPGALASFFLTGTTTPVTVYTDEARTIAHPTPVVANASGQFPIIWGEDGVNLKAVVTEADGSAIDTYDPVVLGNISTQTAGGITFTPVTGNAATDVQAAIANNTATLQGYGTGASADVTDNDDMSVSPANIPTRGNVAGAIQLAAEQGSAALATTSGATVDQAIPAAVQEITILYNGVSVSSTSEVLIRVGPSSTPEVTGYTSNLVDISAGATALSSATTGFTLGIWGAADVIFGSMTLTREAAGSNTWIMRQSNLTGTEYHEGAGAITLSGELDIVQLFTSGATYDAGSISVRWR